MSFQIYPKKEKEKQKVEESEDKLQSIIMDDLKLLKQNHPYMKFKADWYEDDY